MKKNTILIVDNNRESLKNSYQILHNNGFDTMFANNGKAALEILEKRKPDLILISIQMPEMNGFELFGYIKNKFSDVSVIFLTETTEKKEHIEGLRLGAIDYILKPCDTDELSLKIKRFFDNYNNIKTLTEKNEENQLLTEEYIATNDELQRNNQYLLDINEELTHAKAKVEEDEKQIHELYITNTKYNEQIRILLLAIEQSPVTTVITDLQGNIIFANPIFEKTTGYTISEAIGKNPRILKSENAISSTYTELWNTLLSGKSWKGIFHNKKKDGTYYWESAIISPIKDENGSTTHYLAVKEDITEFKKTSDALTKLNKELEDRILQRTVALQLALDIQKNEAKERAKSEKAMLQNKNELQHQNELFTALLKCIPIGVFMVEAPSGKPLIANEEALKLLGKGVLPDVSKQNLTEVYKSYKKGTNDPYPPDEMPIIIGMEGKASHIDDMVVQHSDGTERQLEVFGVPVKDENNNVWASLVSFIDITDRKILEKALRDSEKRLNQLLNSVTDFKYSVVLEGKSVVKTEYSENCKEITGYSAHEFYKNKFLWFDIIHNDDKEAVKEQIEIIKTKNKTYPLEHRIWHKNKTIRWVRNTPVLRFDISGNMIGYDGLITNITERKLAEVELLESEIKFRTVSDFTYDWEYWIGMDKKIHYMSPSAERITGYHVHEFAANPNLINTIIFPHDIQHWNDHESEALHLGNNETHFKIEYRIVRKDGAVRWIGHVCRQIYVNGECKGVRVSNRDITDQKNAERNLLFNTVEVEERERINFSQELHDGIGPLLSAAKMNLQWMAMPNPNIERIEIIADMEKLIDEAARTIREISFKLSPHILQNFGLVEAIKAYSNKVKEISDINFEFYIENACRMNDKYETIAYRVLCECINNSLKHSKATLITIEIKCIHQKLEAKYFDNGTGFDVNSTIEQHKGIGLMNMKSRLKSINGDIEISSNKGKGTTVYFQFDIEYV